MRPRASNGNVGQDQVPRVVLVARRPRFAASQPFQILQTQRIRARARRPLARCRVAEEPDDDLYAVHVARAPSRATDESIQPRARVTIGKQSRRFVVGGVSFAHRELERAVRTERPRDSRLVVVAESKRLASARHGDDWRPATDGWRTAATPRIDARVGAPRALIAYAPNLENKMRVTAEMIAEASRDLMQ